jgi:fructokinase
VGGGPANTAKALSNLGFGVSFIGGISSDDYGAMIRNELDGVNLSLALKSDLPTALARVSLNASGSASYEFSLEGTATFDFRSEWLPKGEPGILHVGTLGTVVEPGASNLFEWASQMSAPIVFDPNIRPSVLSDKARYRAVFERWAGISTVVKMSSEDLEWLGYSNPARLFDLGFKYLIVTKGKDGIEGFTKEGAASVPGVAVDVVDTVGAGDTVGAIVVEGLAKFGVSGLEDNLLSVLTRAAKAAAITCSRAGAKPPTLAELEG